MLMPVCLLQAQPVVQQSADTVRVTTPDVCLLFKKADVKAVAKLFNPVIELAMPESSQPTYARAQAEQILKKFFDEKKPFNCVQTHRLTRDNDDCTVARLYTEKGMFRLSVRMRPVEGALRIYSIQIAEDND